MLLGLSILNYPKGTFIPQRKWVLIDINSPGFPARRISKKLVFVIPLIAVNLRPQLVLFYETNLYRERIINLNAGNIIYKAMIELKACTEIQIIVHRFINNPK